MRKIRLISYVGIRDKFFLNYHNNGIVFDEAIELSLLSGGIEDYERCKWINNILVPDNFSEVFKLIQKNYCDITLIYLGRKNIDLNILNKILLKCKESRSTTIMVNDKKFVRFNTIRTTLNIIVKEILSRLLCKMNYVFKKSNVDYFIFNSYSANYNIFKKFKPLVNFKSSFFDFNPNTKSVKSTINDKRVGVYLDSYVVFSSHAKKKWGFLPPPKQYYGRIVSYLHNQKKIRNLDEVCIYLHPNSKGLERDFFKDFKILERSEYRLQDLSFCKLCWSPGSDAVITLAINGVESIILTNSSFPKSLYNYHIQKSEMLGLDCVVLNDDFKENYICRQNKNSIKKKIFSLQVDHSKESAATIFGKLIKDYV